MKESDSECGGTFFERVRGGLREKERVGDSVSILDFGEYREFLGSEVRKVKKKHQKKSRFERLSYITVPFVALCTLAHSSRFSLAHRLSAHCVWFIMMYLVDIYILLCSFTLFNHFSTVLLTTCTKKMMNDEMKIKMIED